MLELAWVIPAITFVSFWLILFFGRRLPRQGHEIGVPAVALCFALAIVVAGQWVARDADLELEHGGEHVEAVTEEGAHAPDTAAGGSESDEEHEAAHIRPAVEEEATWFELGDVEVGVGVHVDGFTAAMLFVVTAISLAVHVFSASYMHGDRRYTHYFAALSLFTTGMTLMVVASSTLQLLVGWEIMGLCSFMLIGHWWEEKPNSDAALKAFLTTRTGDVGLLVGIAILFFAAGETFNIAEINAAALGGEMGSTVVTVAAFALLAAVIGKSAQFPLHTWLPDAMAGPTPVSALIHAATMVVAGVYLVARLYGVFWEGMDISVGGVNAVAVAGGVTVIIAAVLAFVQDDIKKVLAYSTVSQLGYMVLALGVGAWTAGIFHLFTHAFFKGLLFLASGSVSHAVHSFDMKTHMGGLRRHMPTTFWTFLIGSVALAGIPPLAGFWSKDEILLGAWENGYEAFLVVGLVGAAMTAAYMTRCVYLTFFGEYRGEHHPHESPRLITAPLVALAGASVVAGLLNAPMLGIEKFHEWTENEVSVIAGVAHHEFGSTAATLAAIGTLVALAGVGIGYALYFRGLLPTGLTRRSRAADVGYTFLANRYYLDHLYTGVVVGGIKGPVARAAYWFNQNVIDGIVNGFGIAATRSGRWVYDHIDQQVVDGAVNGAGFGAQGFGGILRTIQTGQVQQYGALLFGAAVLLGLGLAIFT